MLTSPPPPHVGFKISLRYCIAVRHCHHPCTNTMMKKYLLYSEKLSITKQTQNNNYKNFQEHPYPYMMIELIKNIFTLIKIKLI